MTLGASATSGVILWVGVLILVTLIGGIAMTIARRRMFADDDTQQDAGLMDHLRSMADRGEMTHAEFDAARRRLIERASGASGSSREPAPTPPRDPTAR